MKIRVVAIILMTTNVGRLVLTVSNILLLSKFTLCKYEPWENLKMWYSDFEFDMKAADALHAQMEKNCSEFQNIEPLCFHDCMFRMQYGIMFVDATEGWYTLDDRFALTKLERVILKVKGSETMGMFDASKNKRFMELLFAFCNFPRDYFVFRDNIRSQINDDPSGTYWKLCSEIMTFEDKVKAGEMLACVMRMKHDDT